MISNVQTESIEDITTAPSIQTTEDKERDRLVLAAFPTDRNLDSIGSKNDTATNSPDDLHIRLATNRHDSFVTENSPKSWGCWLRAPSNGGDLLSELNALRLLQTPGLFCNEVNFQRFAIGFSYTHYRGCKRIVIEIRFHRNFIENGWVFLELIKKDSPLGDKAKELLFKLIDEAERQQNEENSTTVLGRVLKQLPQMINSLNVSFPSRV
jgi:hypothetical protein